MFPTWQLCLVSNPVLSQLMLQAFDISKHWFAHLWNLSWSIFTCFVGGFFFVVAAVVVIAIPLISDSDKEHIVSYSCFPFYTPYLVLRTYCVLFQVSVSEVCIETVPYRLWDITVMASQFFFLLILTVSLLFYCSWAELVSYPFCRFNYFEYVCIALKLCLIYSLLSFIPDSPGKKKSIF